MNNEVLLIALSEGIISKIVKSLLDILKSTGKGLTSKPCFSNKNFDLSI
tara:strand:+ start:388 stop:534 length:147 start_codon:yes stop_codon:yes gene_type:complete